MEFKADKNPTVRLTLDGRAEITFSTSKNALNGIDDYKDKELNVKVTTNIKKRSLSQNAYMWVLLHEIGIKTHLPKENVYKQYLKDYGQFEILPIKNEAVDRFKRCWSNNGLGWVTQELGESKITGYTNVIAYYGSSTYDSKEMSRIIDAIVDDCQELGISTMTKQEIMLLANENDIKGE